MEQLQWGHQRECPLWLAGVTSWFLESSFLVEGAETTTAALHTKESGDDVVVMVLERERDSRECTQHKCSL